MFHSFWQKATQSTNVQTHEHFKCETHTFYSFFCLFCWLFLLLFLLFYFVLVLGLFGFYCGFFSISPQANPKTPAQPQELTGMSQLFHIFPSGAVRCWIRGMSEHRRSQGSPVPKRSDPGTSSAWPSRNRCAHCRCFHHSPGKVLAGSSLMQSFLLTLNYSQLFSLSCRNRDVLLGQPSHSWDKEIVTIPEALPPKSPRQKCVGAQNWAGFAIPNSSSSAVPAMSELLNFNFNFNFNCNFNFNFKGLVTALSRLFQVWCHRV